MIKMVVKVVSFFNALSVKLSDKFLLAMVIVSLSAKGALANIPVSDSIREKAEDGNYFEWVEWVIERIYVIILALIGMCAFGYVAWGALMAFIEWRKGKIEFGEFGQQLLVAVGVLVVVLVIVGIANGYVSS